MTETAFIQFINEGTYRIRWFTPNTEVDLCRHATLAAAHVLWNHLSIKNTTVCFHSLSGRLFAERKENENSLNFPVESPEDCMIQKDI